ncbi:hypothetical protein FS837_002547 [Tulasnella sp. UAMH 9824]|nr:hypothetical protein FS837_002547 [Tulasnella sp. UAMH 9824]
MHSRLRAALLGPILLAWAASADLDVYVDGGLSSGWENWSWNTDLNFAATDLYEGLSSISASSTAWAAVSLKLEGLFNTYAGFQFDIACDPSTLQLYFQGTTDSAQSASIPLSAFPSITSTKFTTVVIDFNALPPNGAPLGSGAWDRLNFQALANGATYHIDNMKFLTSINIEPLFLSAEPIGNDLIAITTQGNVDLSTVKVKLSNATVAISKTTTYSPIDTPSKTITYFTLSKSFAAGSLVITAGTNTSFTYTLPAVRYGTINVSNTKPISPDIYGVNWPTSASYIQHLGVTISRWGGNAVTAYNPFGDFTNAGADWYFENRGSDNADDWLGWVSGAGSKTIMTVPALDWVSKDTTSYSFPKSIYPNQAKFDPYNPDAGNGLLANGSSVSPPPDPTRVYTTWNTTLAKKWLRGLVHKPDIVNIDNEIEIASSTHQDMHPIPINYDEELKRVVDFATAAKEALPNVKVAAPSTCSWWFYWTSVVGWSDNTAHNNMDFLPWFLQQMKAKETATGKRLLDYLDIHYYFQPDTSANDAAAKALRLRMTRSLWDPSYVDESWVSDNPQNHQPNNKAVWLLPRMKQLIDQYYPGTKLSIGEWDSSDDGDVTGGLVTADSLGIFGRYGLDGATYWATPDEKGPVGLAYWLYRGYGTYFGSKSVQVNMADNIDNIFGLYAGVDNGKVSLVFINKSTSPLAFYISNVPTGNYFVRHFGGASGNAKWQTTTKLKANTYTVIPAYTAIFMKQA